MAEISQKKIPINEWVQAVKKIKPAGLKPEEKKVFDQLQNFKNIPKTSTKFSNFCIHNLRVKDEKLIHRMWTQLAPALNEQKAKIQTPKETKEQKKAELDQKLKPAKDKKHKDQAKTKQAKSKSEDQTQSAKLKSEGKTQPAKSKSEVKAQPAKLKSENKAQTVKLKPEDKKLLDQLKNFKNIPKTAAEFRKLCTQKLKVKDENLITRIWTRLAPTSNEKKTKDLAPKETKDLKKAKPDAKPFDDKKKKKNKNENKADNMNGNKVANKQDRSDKNLSKAQKNKPVVKEAESDDDLSDMDDEDFVTDSEGDSDLDQSGIGDVSFDDDDDDDEEEDDDDDDEDDDLDDDDDDDLADISLDSEEDDDDDDDDDDD